MSLCPVWLTASRNTGRRIRSANPSATGSGAGSGGHRTDSHLIATFFFASLRKGPSRHVYRATASPRKWNTMKGRVLTVSAVAVSMETCSPIHSFIQNG